MSIRDLFGRSPSPVPAAVSQAVPRGPAAHGKIPAKPDFIRVNAAAFSAAGLDRVFAEGSEAVMQAGGTLPPDSVRFFVCPPTGPLFVGAFRQSRDKVGRRAPLVLFTHLDRNLLGEFPVLMSAMGGFFPPAEFILSSSTELSLESLTQQVGELVDSAEAAEGAVAVARAGLEDRDARASLELALGHYSPEAVGYAIATMVAGARGGTVLSAPALDEVAAFFWLEVLRSQISADATPAFLWTPGGAKIIMGTRGLTTGHFLGLCCPERAGNRFWSIVAPDPERAAKGAETLTEGARQVLAAPSFQVGGLFRALRGL